MTGDTQPINARPQLGRGGAKDLPEATMIYNDPFKRSPGIGNESAGTWMAIGIWLVGGPVLLYVIASAAMR